MTCGLVPGLTHTVTYQVRARDLVTTLFPDAPEFTRKPAVLATGILVALCEWPAMNALRHVIHDHQDSLGTQVHICHRAPVRAGTQLRITAHCTSVTGRASRWDVTAWAGTQPVASGWVQFTVVDTAAFVRRHGLAPTAMATAIRATPTMPPTTAQHLPRYATPDHPHRVSVTPPPPTNVTEKRQSPRQPDHRSVGISTGHYPRTSTRPANKQLYGADTLARTCPRAGVGDGKGYGTR